MGLTTWSYSGYNVRLLGTAWTSQEAGPLGLGDQGARSRVGPELRVPLYSWPKIKRLPLGVMGPFPSNR